MPTTPRGLTTKQDITRAAHDLFITKGYHGTSMRAIADEAGIALGGIYNHFSGKEDIFRSVLLEYHPYTEILPVLQNTQYTDFEAFVRTAARLITDALDSRPDIMNLMFIEIVEFRTAHIPELVERILPLITPILAQFNLAGSELRDLPLQMILRSFIAMILGYYLTKYALGDATPPGFSENALDHFLDIYLHGILNPEAQP